MEVDAFYYTMKIVSVSLFTDFSQFHFPIKDSLKGVRSFYNPSTGHLHDDAVFTTAESLRVLISCENQSFCYLNFAGTTKSMKMKGIAMTSSCNRTSKDKHSDLFSFFFKPGLKYLQIQGIITCALRACQRPILACPA